MTLSKNFYSIRACAVDLLGVSEDEVTLDSDIYTDLGMDSLESVEFVMDVEDLCDVEIDDESANKFRTIGDFVAYVDNYGAQP